MAPVVMVLSTSLVAVPAFMRVEPVTTSGPTSTTMHTSTLSRMPRGGSEQVKNPVRAPSSRACSRAARTYGVVPLAAMPSTKSAGPTVIASIAERAAAGSSSAPSTERCSAGAPPAMIPCTIPGGEPKVGGHSLASRTPRRPLVPAPT